MWLQLIRHVLSNPNPKAVHASGPQGSYDGLRAFNIGEILEVKADGSGRNKPPSKIKLRRFYRPEDVSKDAAYKVRTQSALLNRSAF